MPKATSLLSEMNDRERARFEYRVIQAPSGHWIWVGALTPNGYGIFRVGTRRAGAHRLAYEMRHGQVPENLVIDHLCRLPRCVNPMHLEAVPQRVNFLRGQHQTAIAVRNAQCKRGHAMAGDNLWIGPTGERKCRACNSDRMHARWLRYKAENGIPDRTKGSCALEECDREHYAKGYCKRHYQAR